MKDGDSRAETEIAVFSILEVGLGSLPLAVTSSQLQQLAQLVWLLDEWARKINLTGHRTPEAMAAGLILDAAALAAVLPELAGSSDIADLGTGAGFPGLPLAILVQDARFHLVDSRKKRNHFQREARRRLALHNVAPILGRSDEVDQVPCDLVVAQAMAEPDRALELMSQWACPTGILALPASEAADPPKPPAGFQAPDLRTYVVPVSGTHRRVWVFPPVD